MAKKKQNAAKAKQTKWFYKNKSVKTREKIEDVLAERIKSVRSCGATCKGKKPNIENVINALMLWFFWIGEVEAAKWVKEEFPRLEAFMDKNPREGGELTEDEEPDDDGAAASKSEAAKPSRKGKGGRTKSK